MLRRRPLRPGALAAGPALAEPEPRTRLATEYTRCRRIATEFNLAME
jgi:hypothetical protein